MYSVLASEAVCGEIVGFLCKVNGRVWAYVCNCGRVNRSWVEVAEGMFSHVLVYGGITLLVSTGEG